MEATHQRTWLPRLGTKGTLVHVKLLYATRVEAPDCLGAIQGGCTFFVCAYSQAQVKEGENIYRYGWLLM